MARRHADLVVVGGGAMGLATAWAAAPRADVVLVERFDPGHTRGASHGGERIWRHAYTDGTYVEMALAAERRWRALEAATGGSLLHLVGCVEHGTEAELDALARTSAAHDVPTERLTAVEAGRRWPALRFAGDVLVQPRAGWVGAADGLAALATEAAASGAELRWGTAAQVEPGPGGDGVRVVAGDDEIRAPVAVVTGGAWAADLLAPFDVSLPPLLTTEEAVFFLARRPGVGPGALPSFIHWDRRACYGLPTADGRVKLGEHHTGTPTTGDDRSGRVEPERVARIEDYARRWLPGVVPEVVASTTCLYTTTPTQDFVLDRIGPVVVGAGFSGHGFKFVPEIGHRLAALALDGGATAAPFSLAAHAAAAAGTTGPRQRAPDR